MTPVRWLAVVGGLVVAFLASVAIGGFVGRQLRATPSAPPVAAASPNPATTLAPTVPVPTAAVVTPGPAIPTAASPSSAPTPSPPHTSPPTPTPTAVAPTASPTPALDPPTVEEFTADLSAAIRDGDNQYLVERLHPAVIDRYGLATCRRHIRQSVSEGDVTWEVQSSSPAPWDYVSDGLTTTIHDAWTVIARQPGADPEMRELHFAPADDIWRWFTDCGVPT